MSQPGITEPGGPAMSAPPAAGGNRILSYHPAAPGRADRPCPDWVMIRAAEAAARASGLRITLDAACPCSPGSAWYQADARAWGTGRGIGPGSLGRGQAPQPSRPGALHWQAALDTEAEAGS